jgi:energy-coupling factor transporter ATP-binding protein EcfA2
LQKFDFQRLNNRNGLYLLLGKRNTGKTTWCRFINQHIESSRTGIVVLITQNERLKENWSHHIPKLFIFQPEDANIMSTISKCMNNAIKSCENRGISSHDNRLKLTFILDDVGSESSVMNNNGLKKLASNGRHVNVTVFILAQFLYQVPPKVRSQFEYIFMLASISQKNNKTVNHEFAAHIEHSKFCRILQRSTENHGVLVINTTSSNADDSLYFAHIDQYPIKTVRLGCWIQWAMNHLLYDEHETFDDFCVSENDDPRDGEEEVKKVEGIQGDVMIIDVS